MTHALFCKQGLAICQGINGHRYRSLSRARSHPHALNADLSLPFEGKKNVAPVRNVTLNDDGLVYSLLLIFEKWERVIREGEVGESDQRKIPLHHFYR